MLIIFDCSFTISPAQQLIAEALYSMAVVAHMDSDKYHGYKPNYLESSNWAYDEINGMDISEMEQWWEMLSLGYMLDISTDSITGLVSVALTD